MEEVRYYNFQKQKQQQQQQLLQQIKEQQERAWRAAVSTGNPGTGAAGFEDPYLPGAAAQAAVETRFPKKVGHVQHREKGEAGSGAGSGAGRGAAVAPAATLEDSATRSNGQSSSEAITYIKDEPLFRGGDFKDPHLPGAATAQAVPGATAQAAVEGRVPKEVGHVQHGKKGEAGAGAGRSGADDAPAATPEDSAERTNGESSSEAITYVKGVPLFRGGEEHFPRWKKAFLTVAKQFNIFGALTGGVDIPVADLGKSVQQLQQEGFSAEDIKTHLMAWNTLNRAIKDKGDQDILFRLTSPAAAWRELVRKYCGTTLGAKMQGTKKMLEARVSPTEDPVHALAELIDKARDLRTIGLNIPEELACVIFLVSLPPEYDAFKETIQEEKTMTLDRLVAGLRVHHDRLKQEDRDRAHQNRLKEDRDRLEQDRASAADPAPTAGTGPGIAGDHTLTTETSPGMAGDHTITTETTPGMADDPAPTTGTGPGMAGDHALTTETSPDMAGDNILTTEPIPGMEGDHTITTETTPDISGEIDGEAGEEPIKSQESQNREEVVPTQQESNPPALSKVVLGYPRHALGFIPGEGYAGGGPMPTDSTMCASTLSGSSTPGPWFVDRDSNDTLYWRNNDNGDTAYQLVIQPVPLTPGSTTSNTSGDPEDDHSGSEEKKKVRKAKKGRERDGHWEELYHPVTGAKSYYHTGTKKTTTIDPFF